MRKTYIICYFAVENPKLSINKSERFEIRNTNNVLTCSTTYSNNELKAANSDIGFKATNSDIVFKAANSNNEHKVMDSGDEIQTAKS